MNKLIYSLSCLAIAVLASGCGGGGGGSSQSTTVRPKTMDGVVLTLDNAARMEFVRSSDSPVALNSGDVEFGGFIYTAQPSFNNIRTYENIGGTRSNFRYAQTVSATTYTYRAINENSGVLTLTGTGSLPAFATLFWWSGVGTVLNNSWIQLFFSYSPFDFIIDTSPNTNLVEIAISFSSNGVVVTSDNVTLSLPESPQIGTFDTVRIPSTVELSVGGPVPVDYNPVPDPNAFSRNVPVTLGRKLLVATHGGGDVNKNFSLQFASETGSIAQNPSMIGTTAGVSSGADEVGKVIVSVYDPNLPVPALRSLTTAADYTWKRIPGTLTGEVVLSNIPDDPTLAFDTQLNGKMVLDFAGLTSGTYTAVADADTPDPSEVTGRFILNN